MVDQPHDNLPPAVALLPRNHRRAALVAAGVVVGWAGFNLFWSLGDHPFYFHGELDSALATGAGLSDSFIGSLRQLAAEVRGLNELSLRLPGAVFAALIALLAAIVMAKLRDGLTGYITALLMLVNPLVALAGRIAIDVAWLVPPVMAPLCMGLAVPVRRWLDDDIDRTRRPALMRLAAAAVTLTFALAIVGFTVPSVYEQYHFDPAIAPLMMRMLLQGLVCVVGVWAAMKLFGNAKRRVWALILLGLSLSCTITVGVSVEDALTRRNSAKALVLKVQDDVGRPLASITLVGIEPKAFEFYSSAPVVMAEDLAAVTAGLATATKQPRLWVVADLDRTFEVDAPGAFEWRRPFARWVAILQQPDLPMP